VNRGVIIPDHAVDAEIAAVRSGCDPIEVLKSRIQVRGSPCNFLLGSTLTTLQALRVLSFPEG
jgi:hypothetical protein